MEEGCVPISRERSPEEQRVEARAGCLPISSERGLEAEADALVIARKLFLSKFNSVQQRAVLNALFALAELEVSKEGEVGERTLLGVPATTMTSFVRSLAEQGLSEASVRRTIQELRGLGIISCGSSASKGLPLELTVIGRKLLGVK